MPQPWQFRTEGQQLTAFNRADGTRLSFGVTPERLSAPELLDVKLTDVCSIGCAFCYQDSRPDRGHARLEDVAFIAAEAGKAGVFEVALGGGEVSEYPHFHAALHLFRAAGVVPNFTTRRMRWLAREWPTLRDLVGGVAVSVGSAAEIRLLASLIPISERRSGQLVAQVVMGTVERAELQALVREAGAAGIRVTLLGFKHVGRGETFRPLAYDWWLDDLREHVRHTPISIDTALAAECPAQLEKRLLAGSYHTEEGRFSAYVDAVSMTIAPSSYHNGPNYPFDPHWLDAFAAPDFVQGPATPHTLGRVRLGFATNSSSSHSLVLLREPIEDVPKNPAEWAEAFATKFGTFTASSLKAKKYYLAANLMQAKQYLYPGLTDAEVEAEIRKLCELEPDSPLSSEGIDHQSALWFQKSPDGHGPHPHQFARVKAVLYSLGVSVFGAGDDGSDEHSPRWFTVDFTLDTADFMSMFTLPETFEPLLPNQDQLPSTLYLLGVVRGQRFLQVLQDALQAGVTWDEIRYGLLDEPDFDEDGFQKTERAMQILHRAGIHPPDWLVGGDGDYAPDERWLWFLLYLRTQEAELHEFMASLEAFRKKYPQQSASILTFITFSLGFQKFDHEAFRKLLVALHDPDALADAMGLNSAGWYLRIPEYLSKF